MEMSKATMNSLSMQLNEQLATMKITGALQKSTKMMKEVNTLVKLPELTAIMGRLQMEMTKAGIMDEMVSDTLDLSEFNEEEEEAEEEVEKILGELTGEQFESAGKVPTNALPALSQPDQTDEEEEADLEFMRNRLAALKE
ncbi:Vacuolar protein-sorting-associated protein [Taphrina deformans PYCC 5710]|uniref:Vacuolar protein-sorting-associated protein n=1 Tax=Taphrina deformans (strain PYCC 5710 / ATCC 11124 / CBS 356.35 / IMI 108563 / JCM 9778 / NBRC 8474) TaxID=1097556 RepID=R4XET4_TAPDE|nr:Vacuolar protein-sorting-associated protein [Taphrina deformans PYCC 5710]|eukprot:CCG81882.1 Vacuolar protein-sorting-associated protein [Taphrina deformans PYCC 5710]